MRVGVVIVSRARWQEQLRALETLRPGCVRVHLFGQIDVDQKWGPAFTAGDLDAIRARLAPDGVLLLRTAESAIGADDMRYQLTSPFHDSPQTVAEYCSITPGVVLEVGNEPDRAGLDPYVARFLVLTGLRVARSLLVNVPICVGLPTPEAGNGYLDAYLSDTGDGLGRIPREADSLGWHCYGANTLEEGDYLHQRHQLATVLGYGLPVWITESGIHEARPWADRAQWYARFVAGLPEQVLGVTFFLLDSPDPQWAMYRLGEDGAAALAGALAPGDVQAQQEQQQGERNMLRGIDVASHQGQIDYLAVAAAGYTFAIVKCTGGTRYRNPFYTAQVSGARAAGLLVGHYHYDAEPSEGGGTAAEEAAWFLANADVQPGELVALDVEERSTRDPQRYADWLRIVEAATDTLPFFYTYSSFITEVDPADWAPVAGYPLWFASYDEPPLPAPAPWTKWTILQHSGGSPVPGIAAPTDLNVYPGTLDDLRVYGRAEPETPQSRPGEGSSAQTTGQYINERGETVVWANFGGEAISVLGVNYADLGVSVLNKHDETWDRSIQAGEWQPWVKR